VRQRGGRGGGGGGLAGPGGWDWQRLWVGEKKGGKRRGYRCQAGKHIEATALGYLLLGIFPCHVAWRAFCRLRAKRIDEHVHVIAAKQNTVMVTHGHRCCHGLAIQQRLGHDSAGFQLVHLWVLREGTCSMADTQHIGQGVMGMDEGASVGGAWGGAVTCTRREATTYGWA